MQGFIRSRRPRSSRRIERPTAPVLRESDLAWCEQPVCVPADIHLDACPGRDTYARRPLAATG